MTIEEVEKMLNDSNLTEEKVKSLILEDKDVCREQIINGYYVRTIVSKTIPNGEICLKILAVYDKKGDKNVVQYNIDFENLFGTLLHSIAFAPNELDDLIKEFVRRFNNEKRR